MYKRKLFTTQILFLIALLFAIGVSGTSAQTTAFTYQGKLADSGTPQSTYQMRFELYDALTGGAQIGPTVTDPSVGAPQGVFTVSLDFGAAAFDGTDRFLEIAVKRNAGDPFTVLTPRQKINSVPYAIKSRSSDTATNALNFGGSDPAGFVRYDANGDVGIGAVSNGSKLTVAGVIETTAGGIKFPDTTIQATAGMATVTTNKTLTGSGTPASPLGVASPLLIRDLDNPARQPFRALTTVNNAILATVPAGKRLVIEFASGFVQINSFANVSGLPAIILNIKHAGTLVFLHEIPPQLTYSIVNGTVYVMSQPVRMYVDAGDELQVTFPSGSGLLAARVSVTGYFVDVPDLQRKF